MKAFVINKTIIEMSDIDVCNKTFVTFCHSVWSFDVKV